MRTIKKDNNTYPDKVQLRLVALKQLEEEPVVMETHGGVGDIWAVVYTHVEQGVVFEQDAARTPALARQRPTWAVYEADCVRALELGAGAHLCINLLDVDPYGDPWPALKAFFTSSRPRAPKLVVVVNDGLRQKVRGGGAWDSRTLEPIVQRFGNDLWAKYLGVCQVLMEETAALAGYAVTFFDGYHTGVEQKMTHYLALMEFKEGVWSR